MKRSILIIRCIHGLITLFFILCLGYLYYSGITNQITFWTYGAVIALLAEGTVVVLNNGDCPLGSIHHQLGDDKAFFELVLPKKAAKLAVPVLGGIAVVGFLLAFVF